jgi:hypothetical protein
MRFDPERVRRNVSQAATEDLLDRVTVFRPGMEPEGLELMEAELTSRGISREAIEAHATLRRQAVLFEDSGVAFSCTFCHRPAQGKGWRWHRIWGLLPIFPRYVYYCNVHQPG